jgi:hypothetical protein
MKIDLCCVREWVDGCKGRKGARWVLGGGRRGLREERGGGGRRGRRGRKEGREVEEGDK